MSMRLKESILRWNCRGAASREFVCEMRELLGKFKPMVIILLEPKISGEAANGVCKKLGKS